MRNQVGLGWFFRSSRIVLSLVCLGAVCGWAQTTAGAGSGAVADEMPKDAGALMLLGARLNGLTGEDVQPWRLKASYKLLDEQGKVKEEGTFEELWVGPKKSRIRYASGGHAQTTYFTENGMYRTGDAALPSDLLGAARNQIVEPLPDLDYVRKQSYQMKEITTGGTKLECVSLLEAPSSYELPRFLGLTDCFSADKPILLAEVSVSGTRQSVRTRTLRFQGHSLAGDLTMSHLGKVELTAHVESAELIKVLDAADFTPPVDATLLPQRITIASAVAQGMLVSQVRPHYPMKAKEARVQGTVVMEAVIGKDGAVQSLRVISGPPLLQDEALETVRQWKYKPYQLNGEVVEFTTTVNIVFHLG